MSVRPLPSWRRLVRVVVPVFLLAFTLPQNSPAKPKIEVGAPPPDLTWTTVDGDSLSWEGVRGDGPLVMVFWATWCAVCKKTWPELQELVTTYEDAPLPPTWAAVSLGEPAKKVIPVAEKRAIPGTLIVDPEETNGKQLGIKYVPTVCVLDGNGTVAYFGPAKPKKINKLLASLTLAPETNKE